MQIVHLIREQTESLNRAVTSLRLQRGGGVNTSQESRTENSHKSRLPTQIPGKLAGTLLAR